MKFSSGKSVASINNFFLILVFFSLNGSFLFSETVSGDNLYQVYKVGKIVSSFPANEELNSPEKLYAVANRFIASGASLTDWKRISIPELFPDSAKKSLSKGLSEEAKRLLRAKIVEVQVFRGNLAGVLAELEIGNPSVSIIDQRTCKLIDGKWLNSGERYFETLDEARDAFCSEVSIKVEKPFRPEISNPSKYLKMFSDFLRLNGGDPKAFILKALAEHRIVIMGEVHHRPLYWRFNSSLVSDPDFAKNVGTIYMELPCHAQPLMDTFLAKSELDTSPVIDLLRDMMVSGWPDQEMLDFIVSVWKVNQTLPSNLRVRIVLADCARPWSKWTNPEDIPFHEYEIDRNSIMAKIISEDIRKHNNDKRNALFIVGFMHANLNQSWLGGNIPIHTAGWHLRQEFGDDVFGIFPHGPVETNNGRIFGRLGLGLFDSAIAAVGGKPIAFPLADGPFGDLRFDAAPDQPTGSKFKDGFNGYLYLGPLENEEFSGLIPGFYSDEFVKELDRRWRLTSGEGLVSAWHLPALDGKSVERYFQTSWGKPRTDWKEELGPIDAWEYGDNWEKVFTEVAIKKAMQQPQVLKPIVMDFFEAIKNADYDNPEILWQIPYLTDGKDMWVKWVAKTFKENPIISIELGDVPLNENTKISIKYRLGQKSGVCLEGNLGLKFFPLRNSWVASGGADWHLTAGSLK